MDMRVIEVATGRELKRGDQLSLQRREWEDPELFIYEAPADLTTTGRNVGRVRLTDANGDNTYASAKLFGLSVEPTETNYVTHVGQGAVRVTIYGKGLTAKDADKVARGLLPGAKLGAVQPVNNRALVRVYQKASA